MARTKARELPTGIQHLPAYRPPDPSRVRHCDIWRRALERARAGEQVRVTFPNGV